MCLQYLKNCSAVPYCLVIKLEKSFSLSIYGPNLTCKTVSKFPHSISPLITPLSALPYHYNSRHLQLRTPGPNDKFKKWNWTVQRYSHQQTRKAQQSMTSDTNFTESHASTELMARNTQNSSTFCIKTAIQAYLIRWQT